MKRIFLLLSMISFIVSCSSFGQKTKGSGHVVIKPRTVSSFSSISTDGVFEVLLRQGPEEKVNVETDDNLQDLILVSTANDKLTATIKEGTSFDNPTKITIYITFKDLKNLEVKGVGNVKADSVLHLSSLDFTFDGTGNTSLNLDANSVKAKINSVGSTNFKGRAETLEIIHDGVGNVNSHEMKAGIVRLTHSGVGNVKLDAEKEIYITSSGIGDVTWSGQATIKEENISGLGKVKRN